MEWQRKTGKIYESTQITRITRIDKCLAEIAEIAEMFSLENGSQVRAAKFLLFLLFLRDMKHTFPQSLFIIVPLKAQKLQKSQMSEHELP